MGIILKGILKIEWEGVGWIICPTRGTMGLDRVMIIWFK
jgi:hypothetical protein